MKTYKITVATNEGVVIEQLEIAIADTEEELTSDVMSDKSGFNFAYTEEETADIDPNDYSIEASILRALNYNFKTTDGDIPTPNNDPKPISARIGRPRPAFKGEENEED